MKSGHEIGAILRQNIFAAKILNADLCPLIISYTFLDVFLRYHAAFLKRLSYLPQGIKKRSVIQYEENQTHVCILMLVIVVCMRFILKKICLCRLSMFDFLILLFFVLIKMCIYLPRTAI